MTAYLYRRARPKFNTLKTKLADKKFFALVQCFSKIIVLSIMTGFVIYFPGKWQFFIGPVACLFVFGFAFDSGIVSRLLARKPFRYLAKISYSVYMVHILVSLFFSIFAEKVMPRLGGDLWNASQIPGDLLLIPYLFLVIVFAHFTFKLVEMPGRRAIMAYDFSGRFRRIFLRGKRAHKA